MIDSTFQVGIKKLEAAFNLDPFKKETLKIYYEMLKDISDNTWNSVIEEIIIQEKIFPQNLIAAVKARSWQYE